MRHPNKRKALLWASLTGALVVAGVGVASIRFRSGDWFSRLSYDFPFQFRGGKVPEEIFFISLDQNAKAKLGQPFDQPLARAFHAKLLQRLKQDGPRLILYDILFDEPSKDPFEDEQLAKAIDDLGNVILVGDFEREISTGVLAEVLKPPLPALQSKSAGWGLARILFGPDRVVRKMDTGTEQVPSVSWIAAKQLGVRVAQSEAERWRERWVNYYNAPPFFKKVPFDHALDSQGLPAGFFHNKIVVVGSAPTAGQSGAGREDFGTPFSLFCSGAEMHGLMVLNLLRGDWLKELNSSVQLLMVIFWGMTLGAGLMLVRAWHAVWLAAAGALLVTGTAFVIQLRSHVWWAWLIAAGIQPPCALAWSIGWQYVLESRQRKALRNAFAAYLSPHLADRIAREEFDLSLGGKEVEATVMFTDLAGFTSMSEALKPREVSQILTTYFNQTTRAILAQDGTIIKYMGDSVEAVWGAPLADSRHAERAVLAAWGMNQAGRKEIAGQVLRTRIGINTGLVLAGNLGSDFRFDYAVIGDTTNLASRLETLNKELGTDILISEATRRQLNNRIVTRALGSFLLAGKRQPVAVYEVISIGEAAAQAEWLSVFEQALQSFQKARFDEAEKFFSQVITLRQGQDGPSKFYLQQIAVAPKITSEDSWNGVIVMESK